MYRCFYAKIAEYHRQNILLHPSKHIVCMENMFISNNQGINQT